MNLERAIEIAVEAHKGVVDKGGNPYVLHPLRMMFGQFRGQYTYFNLAVGY